MRPSLCSGGASAGGELKSYSLDQLYEEMAFIAYYNHWSRREILSLPHGERLRWCREISKINQTLNGETARKNIFDV